MERILPLLGICVILYSCQTLPKDPSADKFLGREMWTATNLRIVGDRIYWQNYLNGVILPVGTYIRFLEINGQSAIFVDQDNYQYTFSWRGQGNFEEDADRYFTFDDPNVKLKNLDEMQLRAVEIGAIEKGMSKDLVILACGFPIEMSDDGDTWLYWLTAEKKCAVRFEKGVIVQIIR